MMTAEQMEAEGAAAIERAGQLRAAGKEGLADEFADVGIRYLKEAFVRRRLEFREIGVAPDSADWWKTASSREVARLRPPDQTGGRFSIE